MPVERALESGALALFGEKYDAEVRVLRMGDFSVELCGGTHVGRTGDIGLFKVIAEGGVAAGVRRIEALTGDAALRFVEETEARARAHRVAAQGATRGDRRPGRATPATPEAGRKAEPGFAGQAQPAERSGPLRQAREIAGAKVLAATLEEADASVLRETMDKLKDKLGSAAIVLASVKEGKVVLVAGVTPDLCARCLPGTWSISWRVRWGARAGDAPIWPRPVDRTRANCPER